MKDPQTPASTGTSHLAPEYVVIASESLSGRFQAFPFFTPECVHDDILIAT